MRTIALVIVTLAALGIVSYAWVRYRQLKREAYIRAFPLPIGLFRKLRDRHPGLTSKDCQLVAQGLRQFFLAYLQGGRRFVSMPSQVVDTLWHEFILYTRDYQRFCREGFGRFLHHSPAVALGSLARSNEGLRRVWWHACKQENIDPRGPSRLPLLFALDAKLNIADGYVYHADCEGLRRQHAGRDDMVVYCGGDFGGTDFAGGSDGFGDGGHHGAGDGSAGDGGGGDGGGDSGGCGSGCGGGGCSS